MLNGILCAARKNWKTTTSGLFTALNTWVALFPEDFQSMPKLVHLCKLFAVGGLVSLGIFSRDTKPVPACDVKDKP